MKHLRPSYAPINMTIAVVLMGYRPRSPIRSRDVKFRQIATHDMK